MSAQRQLIERVKQLVRPDQGRIASFVIADPEIYQLELDRVFQKAWLFVAHESELAKSGDYVTRSMGEQPVIVSHGEDGRVRVFLNYCRHRGMEVCRSDAGNSSHFRCPYHGFTYSSTGALTGVPFEKDAYGDALDKSELGLIQARVERYKGAIFATWNHDGPSLEQFLGNMRWYLDFLVGRAEMEVAGPPQRWSVRSAWKVPAENFATDAYHTAFAHGSIAKLKLVGSFNFGSQGYHVTAGAGHGLGLGMSDEPFSYPAEVREEYARHLTREQLQLMDYLKNLHGNVFPNLSVLIPTAVEIDGRKAQTTTLRLWQPKGPHQIEVVSWCLVEKQAPEWWKALARQSYVETFGSSGMFEQDDTELWETMTRNFAGVLARNGDTVLDYSMGLGRQPIAGFPGPGEVYDHKFNEANARAFYRQWLQYLLVEDQA